MFRYEMHDVQRTHNADLWRRQPSLSYLVDAVAWLQVGRDGRHCIQVAFVCPYA